MELNDLVDGQGELTPRGELAAFEGMVGNKNYTTHIRLKMAIKVIEGLRRYLDLAETEAQLLADQRDAVLRWCADREAEGVIRIWDLYSILITDPKDGGTNV